MSRLSAAETADPANDSGDSVSLFPTGLGWMGIVGRVNVVRSVLVGHSSAASVRKAVLQLNRVASTDFEPHQTVFGAGGRQLPGESDWHPKLREALQDYAQGKRVSFSEFDLQLPPRTPFRDKVLAATRQLGYGEITTYGDLARIVGHPGAARAVGTVMSSNRFPILIPCHRVLAAGGKLGGYTSPAGTDLKQRMLDMEQAA